VRNCFLLASLGLIVAVAGCGGSGAREVAQRLPSPPQTFIPGHVVTVPVDRSLTVTPLPTLVPGVPTPVLRSVVPITPTPYVWPAASYTARIYGTVTDAHRHAPIAGAVVSVAGGQRTVRTNAAGRYSMKFPVGGSVSVQVSKSGYLAVPGVGMLTTGKSTRVDFKLQPAGAKGKAPPAFPVIIGHPH
jgi:Carboxypeptidase regulatory-like domain